VALATSLWQPTESQRQDSNLGRLMAKHGFRHYPDFHRWSVENAGEFWAMIWDELGVIGNRGEQLVEPADDMWRTRFLPEATLNVAENLLQHRGSEPAMVFRGENRDLDRSISRDELRLLVGRLQAALVESGVVAGDRVAAWMPNIIETYAVMLAATSIGAVFSSTSPDFGVDGVVDRFGQIEPKVLFVVDAYYYGGKVHDRTHLYQQVADGIGSVETLVAVRFVGDVGPDPEIESLPAGAVWFDDYVAPHPEQEPDFAPLPFDHPWYVLYSSGTTGKPKSIVHRTGGVLLKHLVEQQLHSDVRPGDRVFYFTTPGWMMWNWLASNLASGATLVLYDGSPFHPSGEVLFDLAQDTRATLFGTSAKFIEALGKSGLNPSESHDLSSIRTVTSTGSALAPEGFKTVYELISSNAMLASISGGTDLCGCLVIGDPTSPVYSGQIQRAALGLDTDVVNSDLTTAAPGQRGELVCRNPFPSMPLGFLNDPGDERFRRAYFERFPGLWHQGDFAEWTPEGGMIIHGRSDATLNPGGVRIGTAEIYRQVEKIDAVLESMAVGQQIDADVRVVLFVVLREGDTLTDELATTIKATIRRGATPRHVPAVIGQVTDLPRTRSGKIAELAVRSVIHGETINNTEALANPEALDEFRDHPVLAR